MRSTTPRWDLRVPLLCAFGVLGWVACQADDSELPPLDPHAQGACAPVEVEPCCRALCEGSGLTDELRERCGFGPASELAVGCTFESVADCDGDGVPNGSDCAPCDGTAFRKRYDLARDSDGDGYSVLGEWDVFVCAGTEPPAGYVVESKVWDCDDSNPAIWRPLVLDADGDGWSVLACVGAETPPEAMDPSAPSLGYDCDDHDPGRQRTVYPILDQDGDGYPAQTPAECAAAGDGVPAGYATRTGSDCNDQDPLIAPDRLDVLFDGVDANCNARDGSFECGGVDDPALCECRPNPPCQLPSTTCSDRPDLALVDIHRVLDCRVLDGDAVTILVANVGGAPFAGSVAMRYSDGAGSGPVLSRALALELAPQQRALIEVSQSFAEVELTTLSGDDCQLDNNSVEVPPPPFSCE